MERPNSDPNRSKEGCDSSIAVLGERLKDTRISNNETFPLFQFLPSELRITIWELAFPEYLTPVPIRCLVIGFQRTSATVEQLSYRPIISAPPARACKESWYALNRTRPQSDITFNLGKNSFITEKGIDISTTIFYLGRGEAHFKICVEILSSIAVKSIAISCRTTEEMLQIFDRIGESFPNIQKVTLLLEPSILNAKERGPQRSPQTAGDFHEMGIQISLPQTLRCSRDIDIPRWLGFDERILCMKIGRKMCSRPRLKLMITDFFDEEYSHDNRVLFSVRV